MTAAAYIPPATVLADRYDHVPLPQLQDDTMRRAAESEADLAACVLWTTQPTDRALAGWRGWEVRQ